MKKIVRLLPMFCMCAMTLLFSSCGGSGRSGGSEGYSDNEEYQTEGMVNIQSGPSLRLNNEMDVLNELSGYSFKDEDGNILKFEGRYPSMTLYMNGTFMDNNFEVTEIGTNSEGYDYAGILASGPNGQVHLMLSELDTDYGHLPSRIFILDVNNPDDLFYRTR